MPAPLIPATGDCSAVRQVVWPIHFHERAPQTPRITSIMEYFAHTSALLTIDVYRSVREEPTIALHHDRARVR